MRLSSLTTTLLLATTASTAPHSKESQPQDINSTLPPVVPINPHFGDKDLIARLMTAPTQVDRFRLLDQPGDFIFDFNGNSTTSGPRTQGRGGFTLAATAHTMPALIGNGGAMTVGFLGPCGMNTPHVHNRATELNVVVQGRLATNFMMENGGRPLQNLLSRFQMAVFPQGALHMEFNPDCDDAVFVAGFNNADPGVGQMAQNLFVLRPDVVGATLGGVPTINGKDIETFRGMIPANVALGVDACLDKCGIKRNEKRSVDEVLAESAVSM
ncbi:methylitaconate delta2-delta3-isomerase [Ophiocordyceps camponoti-floridani]|uniref:Methylitaconate delta2-delta3-isomerase n=1 Tax=Ophiocordyceps camponoti-floridani TaxID=2030778 RepID=A0A8H4Q890_9HYPO|nr:methylitaconate delta2-delta3-isomerase [Ophiocordyceps camponoti-floridani]